jgi:hypothetical protein
VDTIAPAPARPSATGLPSLLQTKGKLEKTYAQVTQHVYEVLHKSGKAEYKQQPKYNLTTGEFTVDTPTDTPVKSLSMFNMILEKFRHIVVTRDHLSESELHTLISWVHLQIAIGKPLEIVERCFKVFLKRMDEDHSKMLFKLVKKEGGSIMQEQTDIHSFQRSAAKETTEISADVAAARKAQAASDRAKAAANSNLPPLPLVKPNSVSCWYHTNGLNCAAAIKVNGKCRYEHLHGTCGMPLPGGGFCLEKHKAADHK